MKGCSTVLFYGGFVFAVIGSLSFFLQSQPAAIYYDMKLAGLVIILGSLLTVAIGLKMARSKTALLLSLTSIAIILAGVFVVRSYFTYRTESVQFSSGQIQLEGTLLKPLGAGPFPGVVIVHDTNLTTRRDNLVFAEFFVRRGFVALSYDKRGYGQSQGPLPYTIPDLASDAKAAWSFLNAREDVDQVGMWALGEGGWTATLAASQLNVPPAFMIMVSGSGVTPAQQRLWLYDSRARHHGLNATERSWTREILEKADQYYRTGEGEEPVLDQINRIKHELWFRRSMAMEPGQVPQTLNGWLSDWNYAKDLDLDPVTLITRIKTPWLFIFGDEDTIFPTSACLTNLERMNSAPGETGDYRIMSFPHATHYIMTPQEFFDPRFFRNMDQWLEEKVKQGE